MQYRAFAHKVVVVLPHTKGKLIKNKVDMFKNLGVGLMLFDIENKGYELILKPLKSSPLSKHHNLFTLGKLAFEQNKNEKRI